MDELICREVTIVKARPSQQCGDDTQSPTLCNDSEAKRKRKRTLPSNITLLRDERLSQVGNIPQPVEWKVMVENEIQTGTKYYRNCLHTEYSIDN